MKRRTPDKEKAKSLIAMAQNITERIGETNKDKYNTQIVKDYYESLHCLAEAIAAQHGYKSSGTGSHEQLIAWVVAHATLTAAEADLFDRLRNHRNRITYEGAHLPPDFLHRNEERVQRLFEKLMHAATRERL